ncbi:NYN domain-containing protein [Rhodococcoides corynebacterioides]|uniref:NYN domain-containing protein n=1 Tax=Rhodococcoides corynebacterioides TaxID=53972 RepID=A0ABS7P3V6_9NOCA|nr:NYN domain-containing protein [Rhodococcus corynebacterioides]MBY6367078.1 NYN domain-containing protein [Rhodococcus corynebacterioides]MBY6407339.1 NYN domain-containing protein [Rhodococcus corynebacterioides]
MKVGVYVDAYNLYYGGRSFCGRGTSGWRWLDVRALAESLCGWQGATVARVVYCTARVDPNDDQSAYTDQDIYLKALKAHGSIDALQLGRYVAWPKRAPLAVKKPNGKAELLVPDGTESWTSSLPISLERNPKVPAGMLLATVRMREEKGSDVNVATHLLADVLTNQVDGAIVISNDSDLALPLEIARTFVPVGTVNPGDKPLAGALRGLKTDGPGRHFWAQLSPKHYQDNQLPETVAARWTKPADW